jgi:hypothetical protein
MAASAMPRAASIAAIRGPRSSAATTLNADSPPGSVGGASWPLHFACATGLVTLLSAVDSGGEGLYWGVLDGHGPGAAIAFPPGRGQLH